MESKIVEDYKGEGRAGTFLIAEGFDRRHDRVKKHIEDYHEIFLSMEETYGRVCAQVLPRRVVKTKGNSVTEYLLNETQTIFLGTLFRTSSRKKDDPVLLFKSRLAKEFVSIRKQQLGFKKHQQKPEYQIARDAGKLIRKGATDAMKEFIEYAKAQGSTNADKYYVSITKMLNSLLFVSNGHFQVSRSVLSIPQLMTISSAEQIVDRGLAIGMREKKYYKDIYQDIKSKVQLFADMHGQSEVMAKQLELL